VGTGTTEAQSSPSSRNASARVTETGTGTLVDAIADALYIGVGLTILGVQRTNVARRAFRADIERIIGGPITLPSVAAAAAELWEQTVGVRAAREDS
jgi:predicted HAD superfamily Cof-like phosphohydrolase